MTSPRAISIYKTPDYRVVMIRRVSSLTRAVPTSVYAYMRIFLVVLAIRFFLHWLTGAPLK